MSTLRKLRQRTFVPAERGDSGSPEGVRCPPAPPGSYYVVVNGEYRLVSGRSPLPNTPGGTGNCPPVNYVRQCEPNPTDPTRQDCYWVPDIPLGGTRIC